MKLTFTQAALEDLRSIRAYTLETRGVEQEDRYLNRIWARFDSIRLDPARYRQRPDFFPGCRIAAEGKHVILFRQAQTCSKSSGCSMPPWISNVISPRMTKSERVPQGGVFTR